MSWKQLVTPNLSTAGNIGYCLSFIEAAFNTLHIDPYAYTAWEHTQAKHEDQNFPDGMYVPIWFSYMVGSVDEGHVAIRKPDGTVLSSPWQSGTTQATLPSIAELERIYSDNGVHPLTYLGWSEDLAGVQLVEQEADTPPPPLYTVTETYDPGKQIQLNKQPTYLWGMNYDFDTMVKNPVETHNQGEIWTVTNKVHHEDGYDYYRRDGQVDGFNVLDCDDYTPPPAPVVPPVPYVPPAAPVTGNPAQKYTLLTTLMTFKTSSDALGLHNGQTTLKPGTYFVWATDGKAYQLGTDNMHTPTDNWVNTNQNKAPLPPTTRIDPPELTTAVVNPLPSDVDITNPANWRSTLNLGYAGLFVFIVDTSVIDLEGKNPTKYAKNGDYLQISGKFIGPDGRDYARPKNGEGAFIWYGIPIGNLKPYEEVYGTKTTLAEREALHTLTLADRLELGLQTIKSIGSNIMDVLPGKKKK